MLRSRSAGRLMKDTGGKSVKYRQRWRVKGGKERASGVEERTPVNPGAEQNWGELSPPP